MEILFRSYGRRIKSDKKKHYQSLKNFKLKTSKIKASEKYPCRLCKYCIGQVGFI